MIEQIPPLPEIPDALRIAARTGRLVPFVGAGASRLADSPDWLGFAKAVQGQLVNAGAISADEAEQIDKETPSPRLKLSFWRNIAARKKVKLDYEGALHKACDMRNRNGRDLYRALGKLSKTFVTTNYDYWLDFEIANDGKDGAGATATDTARSNIVHRRADISFSQLLKPGTVLHLHGSLIDPENMIVTTAQYMNYYGAPNSREETENNVTTFLKDLFRERVVLFVGYSLADLEILEYVILKAQLESERPKPYVLQSFPAEQLAIANLYAEYYSQDCGIVMLPFLRGERGYTRLIDALDYLANTIPGNNILETERQLQMEAMLP